MTSRTIQFTARGNAKTVTISFLGGREVAVAEGNATDDVSAVAANAFYARYPDGGEATVAGEITISAEVS